MPAVDYRVVRKMVSMAEVLRLLDYPLPLAEADRMRGPCPVHRSTSSKSRTFSVHLKRNVFHCFRCGAAGNHLDLYAAVTGLRLYQVKRRSCSANGSVGQFPGWSHLDEIGHTEKPPSQRRRDDT